MATALLGYGAVFETSDGNSPGIYTAFLEVTDISPPTLTVDTIDTAHEMPPNSTRESFPGMMDWGDVQISFNYVPGNASVLALFAETVTKPILTRRITFPNGRRVWFDCYLTGWETSQSAGDKMSATASFKVTGEILFT